MDELPTLDALTTRALALGALGLVAWRMGIAAGVIALCASTLGFVRAYSSLSDWYMAQLILSEAGEGYASGVRAATLACLFLHVLGAAWSPLRIATLSLCLGLTSVLLREVADPLWSAANALAICFGIAALFSDVQPSQRARFRGAAFGGAACAALAWMIVPGPERFYVGEPGIVRDTRAVFSAQKAYAELNDGYYDTLACLANPGSCLPSARDVTPFLDAQLGGGVRKQGYQRSLHPGPKPEHQPGTLSPSSTTRFAYVGVPADPTRPELPVVCGDDTGRICFWRDPPTSPVLLGRCAASCLDVHPLTPEQDALEGVRSVQAAQKEYASHPPFQFGSLECLFEPPRCLGTATKPPLKLLDDPRLLSSSVIKGYRRQFQLGRDAMHFAYIAVPEGGAMQIGFCGDDTGRVCFTDYARVPPLLEGRCEMGERFLKSAESDVRYGLARCK